MRTGKRQIAKRQLPQQSQRFFHGQRVVRLDRGLAGAHGDLFVIDPFAGRAALYILLENYDFKLGRAEVAYKVHKPFRNKGIATEMLKEFIDIIPQYFCLFFFDAKVKSDNYPSCKVLEKAGFKEKYSGNPLEERKYYFRDTEEELMEESSKAFVETIEKTIEKLKSEKRWG